MTKNHLTIWINGATNHIKNPSPSETLIEYLRKQGKTGTKLVCGEGGCGACTVMLQSFNHSLKKIENISINSCLIPLCAIDGKSIITVEGVGNFQDKNKMHPLQEAIINSHGSQCGFCTPGMIMSLYTLWRNNRTPTALEIEESLDGNLCRCTGYRPILEGARKFFQCCKSNGKKKNCSCQQGERENKVLAVVKKEVFSQEAIFPVELRKKNNVELFIEGEDITWIKPTCYERLLSLKKQLKNNCKILNGFTEISIETSYKFFGRISKYTTLIDCNDIKELKKFEIKKDGMLIGSGVKLSKIYNTLKKLAKREKPNSPKKRTFDCLVKQLHYFSGTQIRNVASIGGNIITASPISDLNPIWIAMNATLYLKNATGDEKLRKEPIRNFFVAYRKTTIKPTEILESIWVPFCRPNEFVSSYKQSRRREDDIAIVNAGIRMKISTKDNTTIEECCLCFGGLAGISKTTPETQKYLIGKSVLGNDLEKATDILLTECYLPNNIIGGMPHYRQTLAIGFFFRFCNNVKYQLAQQQPSPQGEFFGEHFKRKHSRGKQIYYTKKKRKISGIGKNS